jgi:hypothetical protein
MKKNLIGVVRAALLLAILASAVTVPPAVAAVANVSGKPPVTVVLPAGDPKAVAVSLANGFPLWYGDGSQFGGVPLKLQLCTDSVLTITPPGVIPAVAVNPCDYEPPLFGAPPSFPSNFGAEAIYWSAVALGSYTSSTPSPTGLPNSALLVLTLQGAGANAAALVDGTQAVFSRSRIRVDVPVPGTYRITYPYGSKDYVVTSPGLRAINQTLDIGLVDLLGPPIVPAAQNFLLGMNNVVPTPVEPIPFSPAISAGIVNTTGATVGPFLVPAVAHGGSFTPDLPATFAGGPILVNNVPTYLGLPFAPPAAAALTIPVSVFQPVVGGPNGNVFSIELRDPPLGFFLNTTNNSQVILFDKFLIIGKIFNDGPNLAPVAVADSAATAANRPVAIDVAANDIDPIAPNNVHGINSQAIALADVNGPLLNAKGMPLLTATQPTTAGGTVRRISNIATGRSTFLYTPPPDVNGVPFFGIDTFQYVVQDSGGLISAPATVSVLVENLLIARADFRARTGKWHIRGTSSDSTANTVTLFAGPRARLTPEAEVQVLPVTSAARGSATVRVSDSAIELIFKLDPLPATPITAAHLHVVGAPGSNRPDPIIFNLFNRTAGIPFANPTRLTLDAITLQRHPEVGVSTIEDAVNAILSGNVYINVHTTGFPDGEIRGQFIRPRIGTAVVGTGGWELHSHSTVNPGALPSIIIESSNGVRVLGTPLRRR